MTMPPNPPSRLATITARTLGIILALACFVGLYLVVKPWEAP